MMIFKKLIKYKMLEFCLDVLAKNLYVNLFLVNKVMVGKFFKRIEYSLDKYHSCTVVFTNCIILRKYLNSDKENYIDFSFDKMYIGGIDYDTTNMTKENHRSKSQCALDKAILVE